MFTIEKYKQSRLSSVTKQKLRTQEFELVKIKGITEYKRQSCHFGISKLANPPNKKPNIEPSFTTMEGTTSRSAEMPTLRVPVLLLLLLLTGLAGMARGQVLFGGSCPPLKPMAYFEPQQFLGRWFEIARFFASFEGLGGTCWVENYHFDPKRGHFTVLEWKDHLSGRILTIENGITHDKKYEGLLRYALQRPNIPLVRGKYTILATDYSRYALAWQCDDLPLGLAHTEILWFLSKDQFPDPSVVEKVVSLTKKFGLNPEHFEFQNRKGCLY